MVVSTRVSPVTVGLCLVLCLMAASVHGNQKPKRNEEDPDKVVCTSSCIQQLEQSVAKLFAYLEIYQVDWLEKSCDIFGDDCPDGIHAECFAGKCLCTPGYFYSNGHNVCVDNCPQSDQLAEYLIYQGSFVLGGMIKSHGGKSLEDCRTLCEEEPRCTIFDYFSPDRVCFINHVTALQGGVSFRTRYENHVMYQKRCV